MEKLQGTDYLGFWSLLLEQLSSSNNLGEMLNHQLYQNNLQVNNLQMEISVLTETSNKIQAHSGTKSQELKNLKRAINTLELQISSLEQINVLLKEELEEEKLIRVSLQEKIESATVLGIPKSPMTNRRPMSPNVIKRSVSLDSGSNSRPGKAPASKKVKFCRYSGVPKEGPI
jgi:hypothetical protein